jgi:hypothetical protein
MTYKCVNDTAIVYEKLLCVVTIAVDDLCWTRTEGDDPFFQLPWYVAEDRSEDNAWERSERPLTR